MHLLGDSTSTGITLLFFFFFLFRHPDLFSLAFIPRKSSPGRLRLFVFAVKGASLLPLYAGFGLNRDLLAGGLDNLFLDLLFRMPNRLHFRLGRCLVLCGCT